MKNTDTPKLKPFLLLAGDTYYPKKETGDWIGCFATMEEAESKIREERDYITCYRIGDNFYDWVEIVDLRDWIY